MSLNPVSYKKKIEELFKHSLVYGITSSLQNLLGFIMLPILTTFYTPDIFGVYSILLLLSALTSAIFYLGASSALGRFYFDEDSDLFRKKILTTSLLVSLVGAGLLDVSGIIFSKRLSIQLFQTDIYARSIELILIGTAFSFLLNLMTLFLRYEKKSFHFFLIIISGVMINFSITYVLLSRYKFGLLAPIYGLLISNGICFLILVITRLHLLTKKLEVNHFRMILNFGIQSSVAGFLFYILEWVDRLIIKDLLNLTDVGIYSLGYRLGSVMNILLIMPFTLVWGPLRMQHAKNSDADVFSGKVVSYYTLVGVMILVIAILFGEDVMKLIFVNKNYSSAATVLPIIMFSLFFYGYQSIVDFGIYLHKKIYFYFLVSFFAIFFNVVMNYWLIPKWGYMAAAYITLLTYIITSTSIYFISNIYFKIKVETQRVLIALLSVPFLYSIINFLPITNFLLKLLIGVTTFYLFYNFWLNKSERAYLNNKIGAFMISDK
jgi:O-antigen/teichoic acid export membrane protein